MGTIPAPDIFHDAAQIAQTPINAMGQQAALQGEQQQQAERAIAMQMQRRQLADQDALTRTLSNFDWQKSPLTDLPKAIIQNGGSGQAALQAQQGLIQQRRNLAQLSDEQFAQQQKQADLIQGVHDQVTAAPPEDKQQVYSQGLANLARAGVDVSQESPQYPGDAAFAQNLPAIRMHSAILAEAQKDREVTAQEAKARLENAQAAHQEFINSLTQNSKPGQFDSLVDQIYDPQNTQTGGQNRMTKALVNGAIQRGDLEGAKQIMDQAYQNVQSVNKDIAVATNPQIQQGKVDVAKAEGAARAAIEAATARGSNAALANVPPHLVAPATAAATKAGEDYAQAQSVSQRLQAMMDAAKQGNVVSYQLIPQEGALQVTTSQGVHRINMAEIQNYGGGSLWQRLQGHIGKQLTGESIPSSVLSDMAEMQKIQAEGSQKKYENTIKTVNDTYGSNFKPVEMEPMDRNKTPAPASSGKAVSLAAARQLPQNRGKSDDEIKADIQKYGHAVAP